MREYTGVMFIQNPTNIIAIINFAVIIWHFAVALWVIIIIIIIIVNIIYSQSSRNGQQSCFARLSSDLVLYSSHFFSALRPARDKRISGSGRVSAKDRWFFGHFSKFVFAHAQIAITFPIGITWGNFQSAISQCSFNRFSKFKNLT